MDVKRILKTGIKLLLIIVVFYFLGRALYRDWKEIDFKQLHFNMSLLVLSIIFLCGHFLLFVVGWKMILKELGISLPFLRALKIIFYSELGKYLPGKIWSFAGRMYFCQRIGISADIAFISLVLELALMTISGVLIFLISFLFSSSLNMAVNPLILLPLVILILIAIHPKIMVTIINFFLGLVKRKAIELEFKFSQIFSIMVWYLVIWFCFGIAFYLLINSIIFVSASQIPIITGSFAISTTVGLVAIFAPAGLGVREGILSLLLSNFLPLPLSILLSFLSRIWISAGEAIFIGISTGIRL